MRLLFSAALLAIWSVSAEAADLRVLAPGFVYNAALRDLAADFTKRTGVNVIVGEAGMNVIVDQIKTATPAADVIARQGWGPMAPIVSDGALGGPPEAAAEQVQRYVEAGAQGLNVALRAPWDDRVLDQYLELLPSLRKLS